jgi:CRISPR type III-A-associated protein Csm2
MVRGNFRDQFRQRGYDRDSSGRREGSERRSREGLPEGYLRGGYFDEKGYLREELLTSTAKDVAGSFGRGLKGHQLRRFYNMIKGAETKLEYTGDWKSTNVEVKGLLAFASEAKAKGKVPQAFLEFIERNLELVTKESEKAFVKGFVPHFQAVVGFHKFLYPRE